MLGKTRFYADPTCLPLTVLRDYYIQVVSWILVHLILIDATNHVVSTKEVDVQEVSLARLESGVYGLDAWAWRRLG